MYLGARGVKELEWINGFALKEYLFLLISNEYMHAQHFIEGCTQVGEQKGYRWWKIFNTNQF